MLSCRKLIIDGHEVKLGVWDTAGSERYDTITRMYYRYEVILSYYAIVLTGSCNLVMLAQSIQIVHYLNLIITQYFFCCRDAKAAILCFAVDDEASWDRLKHWVDELNKAEPACQIYICTTKIDLLSRTNFKRAVELSTTQDYCGKIGANLFETSAMLDKGVTELFYQIAQDYLQKHPVEKDGDGEEEELTFQTRGRHAFARA